MELPQPFAHTASGDSPELLTLVDFKWLMASEGHRIDLARLRHDPAYARGCIALAAGSTCAILRQAADRLLLELRLPSPRA